jgi:hypothetical protein
VKPSGAARDPLSHLRAGRGAVGQQRGGERASDVALAGTRGAGEEIGVRCLARRQRSEQQRLGVGVSLDPGEQRSGHPGSLAAAGAAAA